MRISPTQALTELEDAIAKDEPLDVPHCRRLALRATSAIPDPDAAAFTHESLCAAIDTHAGDPADARARLELLRPAVEILTSKQ